MRKNQSLYSNNWDLVANVFNSQCCSKLNAISGEREKERDGVEESEMECSLELHQLQLSSIKLPSDLSGIARKQQQQKDFAGLRLPNRNNRLQLPLPGAHQSKLQRRKCTQ